MGQVNFFEHRYESRFPKKPTDTLFFNSAWLAPVTASKLHKVAFLGYYKVILKGFILILLDL
jgi:hypothetical protein